MGALDMKTVFALVGLVDLATSQGYPASTSGIRAASSTSGEIPVTTTLDASVDDMWNLLVGPVSIAATNTTVSATPVPSTELIPPPPLQYPSDVQPAQSPMMTTNSSWSFPSDFMWGVATSAYQVEGAVSDEGRGPTIYDVLTHRVGGEWVLGNATGDVADNHYYLYKQDIARLAALKMPYYAFSISWSRIFPLGRGPINQAGIAHYDDVIQTCLDYNITPVITLFHWDLPVYLQNLYGGFLSSNFVEDFAAYARFVFNRWGNKVSTWYTFNEPVVFCENYPFPSGYFRNLNASVPAMQQRFFCGHNLLLAHARAYRIAKDELGLDNTRISFKNNGGYKIPLTQSPENVRAAQRGWAFNEAWFADPVFLTGNYPPELLQYVSAFLPNFTSDQVAMINGSADFFAHDAYTSSFYSAPEGGIDACISNSSNPSYPTCYNSTNAYSDADGGWNIGPTGDNVGTPWLHRAADWVPVLLAYIQNRWKSPGGIVLSEFGFSEPFENMRTMLSDVRWDTGRISYLQDYLYGILIALSEGVNVTGAFAWSAFDNLEWNEGYETKFGIQAVNFSDPSLPRTYKASAFYYVDVFNRYLHA